MSQYILSDWRNDNPEEPFIVMGQIDDCRYLERIIDVFRDDRTETTVCQSESGEALVDITETPTLQEINDQDELTARYTSASLFEGVWQEATNTRRLSPTSINNLMQTLHNPDHPTQGA